MQYEGQPLVIGLNAGVDDIPPGEPVIDLDENSLVDVKIAAIITSHTVGTLNTFRSIQGHEPRWRKVKSGRIRYRIGDLIAYLEQRLDKQRANFRLGFTFARERARAEAVADEKSKNQHGKDAVR